jgi:hypothetical protein
MIMENIVLEAGEDVATPEVKFISQTGICEISGESYLEKTYAFYDPLYVWLKEYMETLKKPLTLNMRLKYMNTSSSKCILIMFKMLKDYTEVGGEAQINWYIKNDDDVMKEEVEDLREEAELPIRMIFV